VELTYVVPIAGGAGGDLGFRLLAGYVGENISYSPLIPVPLDEAGAATSSQPNWRGTLATTYNLGPWSALLNTRYIGPMIWDRSRDELGVDTDFKYVSSALYLDGQVAYETEFGGGRQSYYLNIQNLLDKDPTYSPQTGGATPLPTDTNLYDQVGRMYRIGARFEF
jgi:iron complex outermembrane recepter protein